MTPPKKWIITRCTAHGCDGTARVYNNKGDALCRTHKRQLWDGKYRHKDREKPARVTPVPCDSCHYQEKCRLKIWHINFSPYCFVESPQHRYYVERYGKTAEAI